MIEQKIAEMILGCDDILDKDCPFNRFIKPTDPQSKQICAKCRAKAILSAHNAELEGTHANAYIIGFKDAKSEQKNWAIEKRKEYQSKLKEAKQTKPNSIQEQIVLGAKLRMLKEVIDQCVKNS